MGAGRAQAARYRRAGCVRGRAEDRRLGHLARLRGRRVRPRRHARRRRARGGRDAEPAHDRRGAAPGARRRRRGAVAARRGARRDLLPALRVRPVQRGAGGGREEAGAEPAQRGGGLAAPARPARHRGAAPFLLGVRRRRARGRLPRDAVGAARVAARARLPHEPAHGAPGIDRGGRRRVPGVGGSAAPSSTTRSTGS